MAEGTKKIKEKRIDLIGKSQHTKELKHFIKKAAKSDCNCLLIGETGGGKDIVAKSIHCLSKRRDKHFVKFNCANISEDLFESELFGHAKGAFTGATTNKTGLIEKADKGTFFFNEIADAYPYTQAKLLDIIEDKEFRRLGENKSRKIDVRFICATNKNISKMMKKAEFREDLFFRINVLFFHIKPLRERKQDIPLLVKSYLEKKSLELSQNIIINKEAVSKLMNYSFPGNVRELENILERAFSLSNSGEITRDEIEFTISNIAYLKKESKSNITPEKAIQTIKKFNGNKTKAAKALCISRPTLYELEKKANKYK